MERHERGCTNNPNRICTMHQYVDGVQKPLAELSAILLANGPEKEKQLRDAADNCPACILATLRQTRGPIIYDDQYPDEIRTDVGFAFDFKKELERFWQEANDGRDRAEYR